MNCLTMRSSSEWKLITARRPSGARRASAAFESGLEFGELAVHVDAQGLKHARGRMLVALLAAGDPRNHPGQLQGALEGLRFAVLDDGARDARRLALLAVFAKDADQLIQGSAVDDIGGARADARRHAHIQRPVLHEAEAARGIVELRRGDAQIEQDAVELEARFDLVRAILEGGKRREKQRHPRIGCEACLGLRDGRRITVET